MVIDWIFNDVSVCVLHVVNFEPLSIMVKGSNTLLSSLSHTGVQGECGVGGPLGLIPAQGVVGEWHTRAFFTFLSADVPVSPLSLLMCAPQACRCVTQCGRNAHVAWHAHALARAHSILTTRDDTHPSLGAAL
jgi:hypothetical protein